MIDQNVAQDNNIRAGLESIKFSYEAVVDGNEVVLDFEEHLTGTMSLDECADSYTSWILVIEEGMFEMHLKQKLSEEVTGFDEWKWRALGLIDFETKKCFENVEFIGNTVKGSAGWAINGNSKVNRKSNKCLFTTRK